MTALGSSPRTRGRILLWSGSPATIERVSGISTDESGLLAVEAQTALVLHSVMAGVAARPEDRLDIANEIDLRRRHLIRMYDMGNSQNESRDKPQDRDRQLRPLMS